MLKEIAVFSIILVLSAMPALAHSVSSEGIIIMSVPPLILGAVYAASISGLEYETMWIHALVLGVIAFAISAP